MVLLQKRIGEVSAITRRKRTVNPFRGPVGHDVEYPRLLAVLDKDKIPRVEIKQRLRIPLEELRPEVQLQKDHDALLDRICQPVAELVQGLIDRECSNEFGTR